MVAVTIMTHAMYDYDTRRLSIMILKKQSVGLRSVVCRVEGASGRVQTRYTVYAIIIDFTDQVYMQISL